MATITEVDRIPIHRARSFHLFHCDCTTAYRSNRIVDVIVLPFRVYLLLLASEHGGIANNAAVSLCARRTFFEFLTTTNRPLSRFRDSNRTQSVNNNNIMTITIRTLEQQNDAKAVIGSQPPRWRRHRFASPHTPTCFRTRRHREYAATPSCTLQTFLSPITTNRPLAYFHEPKSRPQSINNNHIMAITIMNIEQ